MSNLVSSVYTGFWIDWSHGRVYGSTLTISAENSAFLIAFVALFVRFVGGQLWSILAFLTSVVFSTAKPRDGLYHQQQAIFRNTSQPATFTLSMLKLSWFWKDTARHAIRRTLVFVGVSITYIAAFAAAGIFSSKVSSANSEVLLEPTDFCGFWNFPYRRLFDPQQQSYQAYVVQRQQFAMNFNALAKQSHVYAMDCYNIDGEVTSDSCLERASSPIEWTTDYHAPCPFSEGMCLAEAISFDTGFLNSRMHFGINTENNDIEYRRIMTCAPVTTDGYVSDYVGPDQANFTEDSFDSSFQGETFLKYSYGQSVLFDDNTTFAYSNYSWSYSAGWDQDFEIYHIDVEFASCAPEDLSGLATDTFVAIPEISRTDADIVLIFLSINATYNEEVRDPWIRATVLTETKIQSPFGADEPVNLYTADKLVNVMACAEQHQLRNPSTGEVTAISGFNAATVTQALQLGFNDDQMAIFNRSLIWGLRSVMSEIIPALGGPNMLASRFQDTFSSLSLPENQWQLELAHWFGVSLHTIQLQSIQYVTGPSSELMNEYIALASDSTEQKMCTNQIIRRTDYRSFSVLGLCIIFIVGITIIVINLMIRPLVEKMRGKTVAGRYGDTEWQANDFLQLQRMAYQHDNIGTWTGHKDLVPRTRPDEEFTLPDSTGWKEEIREPTEESKQKHRAFKSWFQKSSPQDTVASTPPKAETGATNQEKQPEVSHVAISEKFDEVTATKQNV